LYSPHRIPFPNYWIDLMAALSSLVYRRGDEQIRK
jgi:hypothetical protein